MEDEDQPNAARKDTPELPAESNEPPLPDIAEVDVNNHRIEPRPCLGAETGRDGMSLESSLREAGIGLQKIGFDTVNSASPKPRAIANDMLRKKLAEGGAKRDRPDRSDTGRAAMALSVDERLAKKLPARGAPGPPGGGALLRPPAIASGSADGAVARTSADGAPPPEPPVGKSPETFPEVARPLPPDFVDASAGDPAKGKGRPRPGDRSDAEPAAREMGTEAPHARASRARGPPSPPASGIFDVNETQGTANDAVEGEVMGPPKTDVMVTAELVEPDDGDFYGNGDIITATATPLAKELNCSLRSRRVQAALAAAMIAVAAISATAAAVALSSRSSAQAAAPEPLLGTPTPSSPPNMENGTPTPAPTIALTSFTTGSLTDAPYFKPERCSSPEQVGMTLNSWYFGHTNGGSGKWFECEELCRADPKCNSWMGRNSGNACYLSDDKELKVKPEDCCSDHHPHTLNPENCATNPPKPFPSTPTPSSPSSPPGWEDITPTPTPTIPSTASPSGTPTVKCGLLTMKHLPDTYCQYYSQGGDGSCADGASFADVWRQCEEDGSDRCMGVMWSSCEGQTSDTSVNGAWKLMTAGQNIDACIDGSGHWDAFIRGRCSSPEQVGMTLNSWYFGHTNGGSGKWFECEELCRADPKCNSWMGRNSGNACYLSDDKELKVKPEDCCSDHHPHTFNSDNCMC